SLREPALDRALEEPRAGSRRMARGAKGPATGNVLEDDPAAPLAVALTEQLESLVDASGIVVGRLGELLHLERLRGNDEQRFDRPGELFDRVRRDQPERAFHARLLSASGREILIGAKGAAWASASSFCLQSS